MTEICAFVLLDKHSGPTSHDIVNEVREKLKISRIGHTGTLDPLATGLLILLIGKATKRQSDFLLMSKVYSGTILFGVQTDTWDMSGKILYENPNINCQKNILKNFLPFFEGEITQKIPPYSATKLNGVPLYKLARKNLQLPTLKKKVNVKWLEWQLNGNELFFKILCSSGTYVRSIAYELGEISGYKATLKTLRREEIGPYNVMDAVDIEKFKTSDVLSFLRPL